MHSKQFVVFLMLSFVLGASQQSGYTFQNNNTLTVSASSMRFSRNVSVVDDHVVIWGLGADEYAWIAYPLDSVPFSNFIVEAEVSADTADNRWPEIALALNDSANIQSKQVATSVNWHVVTFEPTPPAEGDSLIFFSFTNDYSNRAKQQDLNLKVRKVTFKKADENLGTVKVSWQPNTESFLAGYKIYYGHESGNYEHEVDVGMATERVLTLDKDHPYFFAVTAYGTSPNSESDFSEEVHFEFSDEVEGDGEEDQPVDCDLNGDGDINMGDWFAFRRAMNSSQGDDRYLEKADFNADGKIDQTDENTANASCLEAWRSSN
ncbi:hypothetical protein GWO43_02170 [candidate division KSB1 bacterium]|nr:hypothetical protein [candidate division KSB1 bacterium]NIR69648.1 hypothetical protein [candidate division KSB1 bacterium]NIS22877.1 hypothetical protein [candidate division KSB1 bacterium]NIT69715.1 hypothetical protein [candidate division KSB1 bacterium]NIU23383.1 hypothetical protein [candidate division KSB1 bacterium]